MYICKNCGKEFTEKYSKWSDGNFCCKKCARSYSTKYSKKTKKSKCVDCGIEIEVNCHVPDKHIRCDDCSYKYLRKRKSKEYFNRKRQKSKGSNNFCLNCGKEILLNKTFCNCQCNIEYRKKQMDKLIESGSNTSHRKLRTYFLRHYNKCMNPNCKWDWNDNHENPVLELHHLDGNHQNNTIDNCILLCPNCHSLTDNYKYKKGHKSTRIYRKKV